jgi:hypothetical protein
VQYRHWLEFNWGSILTGYPDDERLFQLKELFEREGGAEKRSAWFYRGVGFGISEVRVFNNLAYKKSLNWIHVPIPEHRQNDFYWGLGYGARAMFRKDRLRAIHFFERLPLPYAAKQEALKGLEFYEKMSGLNSR